MIGFIEDGERIEIFRKAVEKLDMLGHTAKLYPEYSGRGMSEDDVTPGIVTDAPVMVVGWAVTAAGVEHLEAKPGENLEPIYEMLPQTSDNMGLDKIYYC